jgi:signal transduction histidine kinase
VEDFLKSNILRIVQETYKNTLKHSKATNFSVLFSLNDSRLTLKISDNGKGFNINQKNKGIGLSNIKSRVKEFLKGTLEINTTTDGTVFTITIPNIYDK